MNITTEEEVFELGESFFEKQNRITLERFQNEFKNVPMNSIYYDDIRDGIRYIENMMEKNPGITLTKEKIDIKLLFKQAGIDLSPPDVITLASRRKETLMTKTRKFIGNIVPFKK
jgi:hypothetical protein